MRPLFTFIIFFALTGCTSPQPVTEVGNPVISSPPPLQGIVSKGPVSGARVEVHRLGADGVVGELLAVTTTAADGTFVIDPAPSRPVAIIATGGSYSDEATKVTVSMEAGRELTLWVATGESPAHVAVTPLTTIAVARAAETIAAHGLETAVVQGHQAVAQLFGLEGIDIAGTVPQPPAAGEAATSPAQRYAAALASLSQVAHDHQIDPSQVMQLVGELAADYTDGQIDAMRDGIPLTSSLPLDPTTAIEESREIQQKSLEQGTIPVSETDSTPSDEDVHSTASP